LFCGCKTILIGRRESVEGSYEDRAAWLDTPGHLRQGTRDVGNEFQDSHGGSGLERIVPKRHIACIGHYEHALVWRAVFASTCHLLRDVNTGHAISRGGKKDTPVPCPPAHVQQTVAAVRLAKIPQDVQFLNTIVLLTLSRLVPLVISVSHYPEIKKAVPLRRRYL
jgi:hypothetical protein